MSEDRSAGSFRAGRAEGIALTRDGIVIAGDDGRIELGRAGLHVEGEDGRVALDGRGLRVERREGRVEVGRDGVRVEEAAPHLATRPGDRARRFFLNPYELNPVTEQALVDRTVLSPVEAFADDAAARRAWLVASGCLTDGVDPTDAEWAYHAKLQRVLAELPIEVLEDHFAERLYYGDVIDTADYRGLNALLVGEGRDERGRPTLRVVRTVRATEYYATPPASMTYPSRIPDLRFWEPWYQVSPIPVDHAFLRTRLTAGGAALDLPELGPEPFLLSPSVRATLTNERTTQQLYVDPAAGEVFALDPAAVLIDGQ